MEQVHSLYIIVNDNTILVTVLLNPYKFSDLSQFGFMKTETCSAKIIYKSCRRWAFQAGILSTFWVIFSSPPPCQEKKLKDCKLGILGGVAPFFTLPNAYYFFTMLNFHRDCIVVSLILFVSVSLIWLPQIGWNKHFPLWWTSKSMISSMNWSQWSSHQLWSPAGSVISFHTIPS